MRGAVMLIIPVTGIRIKIRIRRGRERGVERET
jgi:hypothetical protein